MSDDDFSDPYDEPSMEISIETLTGTSFDIRVYPTDTVLDIKNKIQRVEGIPAHHQNLLFQLKELQDFKRLCDIGIVNGSKLKLVLSMRGGPISTRRMSTCDHHIVWKDLKDLIEHSREEIGEKSGSKVSVLVFKEGDVINLIRVIENEDGSYSPYADKTIAPPPYHRGSERDTTQVSFFKKISEDMEMASKMHTLKSKMQNLSVKRQMRGKKESKVKPEKEKSRKKGKDIFEEINLPTIRSRLAYKLVHGKKYESKITVQENEEHHAEIALKEKHRTKKTSKKSEAKFSCENLHVFEPETSSSKEDSDDLLFPGYSRSTARLFDNNLNNTKLSEPIAILEEDTNDLIEVPCAETLSLSGRNRVHLTQFVLQDSERTKSSSESLELEDSSRELWEIEHEPLKKSATYPVSLVKRRTSIDHSYDSDFNIESNDDEFKKSDYELLSRNFYNLPQYVSTPSAIPPQYAPKNGRICAVYLGSPEKSHRSPLYGRRRLTKEDDSKEFEKATGTKRRNSKNYEATVSNIERLCNDFAEPESTKSDIDDIFGIYNSKSIDELDKFLTLRHSKLNRSGTGMACEKSDEKNELGDSKIDNLPSLNKKRMRCEHCNKRLNITNIYNCRCGRMFCSQHRYSEVHNCKYDYKTEGRKILEQQNPLVTASKLPKF